MNSPAEQAAELVRARGGNFREELEAHLLTGFVFSTPEGFVMGRPVPKGADISDVWQHWPAEVCSAWFVWCAVGRALHLLELMPHPLPWVGWARQGRGWAENHWVPTHLLRKRLNSVLVSTAIPC